MATRIRKDDLVKVIAGKHKGTTGKVLAVQSQKNLALVEGIGVGTRHIRPSQINPRGGKKDIHVGVDLSKLALVADEKSSKTSRVGYVHTAEGGKSRVARQLKNKEIK